MLYNNGENYIIEIPLTFILKVQKKKNVELDQRVSKKKKTAKSPIQSPLPLPLPSRKLNVI